MQQSATASGSSVPRDVVAIFHASFHPTQGNTVDWSAKANDDFNLDGVEYCVLPSGLHTVDRDVIYFTHAGHPGICVFNRRATEAHGHRGFRLASLALLLAPSARPRPWRHLAALSGLADTIYSGAEDGDMDTLSEELWEPAKTFFEERKHAGEEGRKWPGWEEELRDCGEEDPALALPTLLRTLGPSSIALYKHILGRQRVLFYTAPPVARAGALCRAAADMALRLQLSPPPNLELSPKAKDGVPLLGMVTLHDLDRLEKASGEGRGWIACTTDALFLERPQYYDLVVDLSPKTGARPALFVSRPIPGAPARGATHRLQSTRFTWSDVRLWTELERILSLDADAFHAAHCPDPSHPSSSSSPSNAQWASPPPSAPQLRWADTWRVYEDVCVLCAGMWNRSRDWSAADDGAVRLEGPDELGVPDGTEADAVELDTGPRPRKPRNTALKRASGMIVRRSSERGTVASKAGVSSTTFELVENEEGLDDDGLTTRARTTLALLRILHAHAALLLVRLSRALPPTEERGSRVTLPAGALTALELGVLSGADARFVAWLGREWAGCEVGVRRGWRDIAGWVFGLGVVGA